MAGTQDQHKPTVARHRLGTTTHLDVSGELDLGSSPELAAAVDDAFDGGPERLVVDLRAVTFIDSSGLSVLLHARDRAEQIGATLVVLRPHGPAAQIFALCGVDGLFPEARHEARRHHPAGASEDGPRFLTDWTR